jgi:ubiquinone/menaquinone biosynthesis C-methylase UbiE
MRGRPTAPILLLMTHTTELPHPPATAKPVRTYALERSRQEHARLTHQAALFKSTTQRLFHAAGLAPGMRVLDVGTGTGDVAFLAAELVGPEGAVVGIDVDSAALVTASARAEDLGLHNVRFVEGDIHTVAVGDDFDAAVGRLVLMYLGDPARALSAIAARVRSGGTIAFQELDLDPEIEARDELQSQTRTSTHRR